MISNRRRIGIPMISIRRQMIGNRGQMMSNRRHCKSTGQGAAGEVALPVARLSAAPLPATRARRPKGLNPRQEAKRTRTSSWFCGPIALLPATRASSRKGRSINPKMAFSSWRALQPAPGGEKVGPEKLRWRSRLGKFFDLLLYRRQQRH